MDFLTRINAVLHHQSPDQIPFAPYDNLVPRGEFARNLRTGGWDCVTAAQRSLPKCPTSRSKPGRRTVT